MESPDGLRCPQHGLALEAVKQHGVDAERCPEDHSIWLRHQQLVELEDRAAGEDMVKGTRRYGEHPADLLCPHCGKDMVRFRYRGYNLEIDACPDDAGFWLDRNEAAEIRDVMRKRATNLRRSRGAERSWRRARFGDRRSVLDRIRDFFGR